MRPSLRSLSPSSFIYTPPERCHNQQQVTGPQHSFGARGTSNSLDSQSIAAVARPSVLSPDNFRGTSIPSSPSAAAAAAGIRSVSAPAENLVAIARSVLAASEQEMGWMDSIFETARAQLGNGLTRLSTPTEGFDHICGDEAALDSIELFDGAAELNSSPSSASRSRPTLPDPPVSADGTGTDDDSSSAHKFGRSGSFKQETASESSENTEEGEIKDCERYPDGDVIPIKAGQNASTTTKERPGFGFATSVTAEDDEVDTLEAIPSKQVSQQPKRHARTMVPKKKSMGGTSTVDEYETSDEEYHRPSCNDQSRSFGADITWKFGAPTEGLCGTEIDPSLQRSSAHQTQRPQSNTACSRNVTPPQPDQRPAWRRFEGAPGQTEDPMTVHMRYQHSLLTQLEGTVTQAARKHWENSLERSSLRDLGAVSAPGPVRSPKKHSARRVPYIISCGPNQGVGRANRCGNAGATSYGLNDGTFGRAARKSHSPTLGDAYSTLNRTVNGSGKSRVGSPLRAGPASWGRSTRRTGDAGSERTAQGARNPTSSHRGLTPIGSYYLNNQQSPSPPSTPPAIARDENPQTFIELISAIAHAKWMAARRHATAPHRAEMQCIRQVERLYTWAEALAKAFADGKRHGPDWETPELLSMEVLGEIVLAGRDLCAWLGEDQGRAWCEGVLRGDIKVEISQEESDD